MDEPFALTNAEKASHLWSRLFIYYEKRLQDARARNDSPLNEMETAKLRGGINEIKHLLGLAESPGDMGS